MTSDTLSNRPDISINKAVTLADVLAPAELELELVAGTEASLSRVVRGAHFTEILDPCTWLEEQWIMMTAGLQMYRDPATQRRLVRDLVKKEATALGYCTGIRTKSIPPALIDEARVTGLPLFHIPLHIPVRLVVTHVHRLVLGTEEELFQRAVALTDYLLAGFDEPTPTSLVPESRIVATLRGLLGLEVDLIDVQGRAVEPGERAEVDLSEVLSGVSDQGSTQLSVHGDEVLAVPCRVGARLTGWLVVHLPDDLPERRYVLAAAEAAAKLVTVAALSRQRSTDNLELLGQHVITHLLQEPLVRQDTVPAELAGLTSTQALPVLRQLGFTPGAPVRAFVVEDAASSPTRPHSLARGLRNCGLPCAWSMLHGDFVASVQCPDDAIAEVAGGLAEPTGVGGPVQVADLRVSVRQARHALKELRVARDRGGSAPGYLSYSALPPASIVAEQLEDTVGPSAVDDYLAPLLAQPLLLEAVVEYLRHDQDTVAAARALHLHPNSLRYRLDRVTALLGAPVRRPSTLASLYLTLNTRNLI